METTSTRPTASRPRELARRTGNGIDVRLVWNPADDRLTVEVLDGAEGTVLVVGVGGRPPMAVFHHPYAYAA